MSKHPYLPSTDSPQNQDGITTITIDPDDDTGYLLTQEQRTNLSAEAHQWLRQGLAHFRQGQYMPALAILQQSLQAYRSLSDRYRESRLLLLLSTLYYRVADYLWATEYARQCLQVAQSIHDHTIVQQALSQLGNSYRHLGDLQKGLDYMTQSLTLARQHCQQDAEMRALNNLAMIYRAKGLSRQAATLYEASLYLSDLLHQPDTKLNILQNLGNTYLALKDFPAAIDYYEQFLALCHQRRFSLAADIRTRRRILKNLVTASLTIGDQLRAVLHLESYLRLVRRLGDSRCEQELLKSLSQCYKTLGNLDHALDYQEQRLQVLLQLQDRDLFLPALIEFEQLCQQAGCRSRLAPYQTIMVAGLD